MAAFQHIAIAALLLRFTVRLRRQGFEDAPVSQSISGASINIILPGARKVIGLTGVLQQTKRAPPRLGAEWAQSCFRAPHREPP
jgi:hypothetical protein